MAIFKNFKGNRENLDNVPLTEGHVYFMDDGSLHFDYKDKEGDLKRAQVGSKLPLTEGHGNNSLEYANIEANAISANSMALGWKSQAGCKGFRISSMSSESDELSDNYNIILDSGWYEIVYQQDFDINSLVGTHYSIHMKAMADKVGTITAVTNIGSAEAPMAKIDVAPYFHPNKWTTLSIEERLEAFQNSYIFSDEWGPEIGEIIIGNGAYTEGQGTRALQNVAHAEGSGSTALGSFSHAEGLNTIAYYAAHAEGGGTKAANYYAHSEGYRTIASGEGSHAEAYGTKAQGKYSHAEGMNAITGENAQAAHAEGRLTQANAAYAHAEGYTTSAESEAAHTEGYETIVNAYSKAGHAEGFKTNVSGLGAHAEGTSTKAFGDGAHSEGEGTSAQAKAAHSEGSGTAATGAAAHAEGTYTKASAGSAHAEGQSTTASGQNSHAEGNWTVASNEAAHAEGYKTEAFGYFSHAEGINTKANKNAAHAEGSGTQALAHYSHTSGVGTVAKVEGQFVAGKYNADNKNSIFIIGNGTEDTIRRNAFTVNFDGTATVGAMPVNGMDVANKDYVDTSIANLVDSAPEALNTLGELATALESHEGAYDALLEVVGNKADKDDVFTKDEVIAIHDVLENEIPSNLRNGSATRAVEMISDQLDDPSGFDFTNKNPNATAIDATLTGIIPYGATGDYASAFGGKSAAMGKRSHAEGTTTIAKGKYSHAEGDNSVTLGDDSHAEGYATVASGTSSHTEGWKTQATAEGAHAQGFMSIASGEASHAEGSASTTHDGPDILYVNPTEASGYASHAEGISTQATGLGAHSEGIYTIASNDYSHAGGYHTKTSRDYQTVIGSYNKDDENALFIVGNGYLMGGSGPSSGPEIFETNAFTVKDTGDVVIAGSLKIGNTTFTEAQLIKILNFIDSIEG